MTNATVTTDVNLINNYFRRLEFFSQIEKLIGKFPLFYLKIM